MNKRLTLTPPQVYGVIYRVWGNSRFTVYLPASEQTLVGYLKKTAKASPRNELKRMDVNAVVIARYEPGYDRVYLLKKCSPQVSAAVIDYYHIEPVDDSLL